MNIEKIFNESGLFKNIKIDTILFEERYPVLFTCLEGDRVYLVICSEVTATKVVWICTETNYDILIQLLKDEMTIRDAFLGYTDEKKVIEYFGPNHSISINIVTENSINKKLLPTAGQYMDAEIGEFDDELKIFEKRNKSYNLFLNLSFYLQKIEILKSFSVVHEFKKKDTLDEFKSIDENCKTLNNTKEFIKTYIN